MLDKIRDLVKKEAEDSDWKYHITLVVKYAKQLARILHVNEEIAELAALLHDIGRLKFGNENHEITGVPEAERIMKAHKYPQSVIDEVKHCVASHRGSKDVPPRTKLAKIIANADAMAHFDILPVFFYSFPKNKTFEERFKWVDDKIERDWRKKITLPAAKKIIKDKYKAIKLVLDSTRQYI